MKAAIGSSDAPQAIGPYSQAIVTGNMLYASGQIPINPASGNIEATDIKAQAHQVLKNIGAVLSAADLKYSDVVKTTVFLTDLNDFGAVNEIYGEYFSQPYPTRSCVQVAALPKSAKIEIEIIANLK